MKGVREDALVHRVHVLVVEWWQASLEVRDRINKWGFIGLPKETDHHLVKEYA